MTTRKHQNYDRLGTKGTSTDPGTILQRFIEHTGINETDPSIIANQIANMSADKIRKYLTLINSYLRNISPKTRNQEAKDDTPVYVEHHVAPPKQIQNKVIESAAKAMPLIDDVKCRGALAYYLINNLHMFPDGNGRTSRAVYEILTNPGQDFASLESLAFHSETESYGHEKFEQKHQLASASMVIGIVTNIQQAELIHDGKINECFGGGQTVSLPINGFTPELYFTKQAISEGLSKSEQSKIRNLFRDIDISTIAMEIMLTSRHQVNEIIAPRQQDGIVIPVEWSLDQFGNPTEVQPATRTFNGWGADDYRELYATALIEQYHQNETIINILSSVSPLESLGGRSLSQYVTNFSHDHQ